MEDEVWIDLRPLEKYDISGKDLFDLLHGITHPAPKRVPCWTDEQWRRITEYAPGIESAK